MYGGIIFTDSNVFFRKLTIQHCHFQEIVMTAHASTRDLFGCACIYSLGMSDAFASYLCFSHIITDSHGIIRIHYAENKSMVNIQSDDLYYFKEVASKNSNFTSITINYFQPQFMYHQTNYFNLISSKFSAGEFDNCYFDKCLVHDFSPKLISNSYFYDCQILSIDQKTVIINFYSNNNYLNYSFNITSLSPPPSIIPDLSNCTDLIGDVFEIRNQEIRSQLSDFTLYSFVIIEDCQFLFLPTQYNDGSAIYLYENELISGSVKNCIFRDCNNLRNGPGAIMMFSNDDALFAIISCCCQSCYGTDAFIQLLTHQDDTTYINETSIALCKYEPNTDINNLIEISCPDFVSAQNNISRSITSKQIYDTRGVTSGPTILYSQFLLLESNGSCFSISSNSQVIHSNFINNSFQNSLASVQYSFLINKITIVFSACSFLKTNTNYSSRIIQLQGCSFDKEINSLLFSPYCFLPPSKVGFRLAYLWFIIPLSLIGVIAIVVFIFAMVQRKRSKIVLDRLELERNILTDMG